jgi:hypothetical protein
VLIVVGQVCERRLLSSKFFDEPAGHGVQSLDELEALRYGQDIVAPTSALEIDSLKVH